MDAENIPHEKLFEEDQGRYSGKRFYTPAPKSEWIPYGLLALLYILILALFITVFSGSNSSAPSKEFMTLKDMNDFREKVKNLSSDIDNLHTSFKKKTCESGWKQFDDSCYYLTIVKADWPTTRSVCLKNKADLAVITNDREQIFLTSFSGASSSKRFWIGLHDMDEEGTWIWVDGTNFKASYKNWKRGEPNDNDENEDCVHMWSFGEWNDVPCDYDNAYGICEKKL